MKRKEINKDAVIVLGGNLDQLPYIKELKKLGFYILLTDLNQDCPGKIYADDFGNIGYEDVDKLLAFIDERDFKKDVKVFTASAQFSYIGASSIANHLGLEYPSLSTIEMCLDKTKFYKEFESEHIPIPETHFVRTRKSLDEVLKKIDCGQFFYLKSDFSKNPDYVYRFKAVDDREHVFWGSDRYLRDTYILQPEFIGSHVRLNLFDGNFNLFDFKNNGLLDVELDICNIQKLNVIEILDGFTRRYNLNSFLVKFDIVVSNDSWVVLDIGLDPPSRMKLYADEHGIDFTKFYVNFLINRLIDPKDIGPLSF